MTQTFKPTIWYPIAALLSVLNVVGLGYAVGIAEPGHAAIHGVLALWFGLWARRLRQRPGESADEPRVEALDAEARVEALEADVSNLRQALSETQERLDFAERLLAQGREPRRAEPQR